MIMSSSTWKPSNFLRERRESIGGLRGRSNWWTLLYKRYILIHWLLVSISYDIFVQSVLTVSHYYWLVVYLPLWKMRGFVSWDDDIPNWMERHKNDVPNHQPVYNKKWPIYSWFMIKKKWFFHSYVNVYQRVYYIIHKLGDTLPDDESVEWSSSMGRMIIRFPGSVWWCVFQMRIMMMGDIVHMYIYI